MQSWSSVQSELRRRNLRNSSARQPDWPLFKVTELAQYQLHDMQVQRAGQSCASLKADGGKEDLTKQLENGMHRAFQVAFSGTSIASEWLMRHMDSAKTT